MAGPEILFLKQEDVIAAGILDMEMVLGLVEEAFRWEGTGGIINPPKTMISIPEDEAWESRFISMPVHISRLNRPGIKWAAESTANMKAGHIPMGIDVVILSDPVTVLPVAIMDGTLITAMRTAAAAGVAAKYLAPARAAVAGCIGAGVIGRTMIMALSQVLPHLREVRLCDLNRGKAEKLAAEFAGQVPVTVVDDAEAAVTGADVIATMTTSRRPFVKSRWVKDGATVIQMSSYEVETDVITRADRIVVDNWEQMKENTASVFVELLNKGLLAETDVVRLREVVVNSKPGRESDDQLIMFGSRGMGCLDIVVADRIYQEAMAKGLGQKLVLWDEAKWL